MPQGRNREAIGYCEDCGKLLYDSKSKARRAAKRHESERQHKGAYPCPSNGTLFHVGKVPEEVVRGEMTRAEFFGHEEVA